MSELTPEQSDEYTEESTMTLARAIQYAHGGEQHDTKLLVLLPPSGRHGKECARLTQAAIRASGEHQARTEKQSPGIEAGADVAEGTDPGEIPAEGVIALLSMSETIDLADVYATARRLFCEGVIMVGGDTAMKSVHIDRMLASDFSQLVGTYVRDFILASDS